MSAKQIILPKDIENIVKVILIQKKEASKNAFMSHVIKNKINIDFEDLIFFATTLENLPTNSEEFLEEILKLFSQPIYSVK